MDGAKSGPVLFATDLLRLSVITGAEHSRKLSVQIDILRRYTFRAVEPINMSLNVPPCCHRAAV